LLVAIAAVACAAEPGPGGGMGGQGGSDEPPPPRKDARPVTPVADSSAPPEVDAGTPGSGGAPGTGGTSGKDGGAADTGSASDTGAGSGDGGPAGSIIDNPLGPLPMDLKDVGIFTAIPDLTKVHPRAFGFTPRYPLWSNGLEKVRYAVIPNGMKINTSKRDAWDFPVGTLFFKTFSVKDPANAAKTIPVETRLIRRVSTTGEVFEQWEFNVWEWNATGTAATLLDLKKRVPREVTVDGVKFTHNIPSRKDCWNCHIANKAPIIGFDELRLNSKLTPTATTTQLDQVVAKQWLTQAPTPPIIEVTGRTPAEKAALEYLQANCSHCHNGEQPLEPGARYPALDLRYTQAVKNTVNVMTMSVGTAPGIRVVPGDPMKSILFLAVQAIGNPSANMEVKPMPTVGVDRMDPTAVQLLRDWIMALR
jgi:hypothetical protein